MKTEPLPSSLIRDLVAAALDEDRAFEDATTKATVPGDQRAEAMIISKENGVICGVGLAAAAFDCLDPGVLFKTYAVDGQRIGKDQPVATIMGQARAILSAERVALNFLQRLSGIATMTARAVEEIEGTGATILDTRKTTPGLRAIEKYAVRCGGGTNHRMDLGDAILLKDNHLAAARLRKMTLGDLVREATRNAAGLSVEVEITGIAEAEEALAAGATRLLLDNMSPAEMTTVVELARGRAQTEASGGITLDNVRAVAETGVDFISLGALTHSVRALDLSLKLIAG